MPDRGCELAGVATGRTTRLPFEVELPSTDRANVGIIIKVLVNAAALWVAVTLLEGFRFDFDEGTILAFLGIALIMGIVNVIVRPIITVLALPAILLTLGLFLLVVNAISLAIVVAISGALDLGLVSDGFGWTFLAALVISLVSWALEAVLGR